MKFFINEQEMKNNLYNDKLFITYLNRTPISFEFISFAVDSITVPKSPPLLPPLPIIASADLRIK